MTQTPKYRLEINGNPMLSCRTNCKNAKEAFRGLHSFLKEHGILIHPHSLGVSYTLWDENNDVVDYGTIQYGKEAGEWTEEELYDPFINRKRPHPAAADYSWLKNSGKPTSDEAK